MRKHPLFSLFGSPQDWQVFASGHAEGKISAIHDAKGAPGLRLAYDFHGGGGFVVIRRAMTIEMPESFEIGFLLRGEGPPNHFEFKVADPGGTNVWRHLAADFQMPASWTSHRFNERDLLFAWGPAGGGAPKEIGAIEFVIAAGPGGKGTLELAAPVFEDQTLHTPARIHASSKGEDCPPEPVFRGSGNPAWRATAGDAKPWWQVDFGDKHRFGGLVIRWPELLPARNFVVEISQDAKTWAIIHRAQGALGNLTHIPTPGAEASFLRILFANSTCAALLSVELRPDSFSRTPNEFLHHVAADYPRGRFPRYWLREQSYWTPVGSPEGKRRALINEEGMIEVDEAGFSLEPFVMMDGRLLTWSDVKTTCLLPKDGMPMPEVKWNTPDMTLKIRPWVDGGGDDMTLHMTYLLRFTKPVQTAKLIVGVRPFQVNPPWQAFRNLGGHSPIHRIKCNEDGMIVENRIVTVTPRPDQVDASAFEETATLIDDAIKPPSSVDDPSGLASAEMVWQIREGHDSIEVTVSVPYGRRTKKPGKNSRSNARQSSMEGPIHCGAGTGLFPNRSRTHPHQPGWSCDPTGTAEIYQIMGP
jgi:F5/8 type C domain